MKLCIELGEQSIGMALLKDSRLRIYGYERRHGRLRVKALQRALSSVVRVER